MAELLTIKAIAQRLNMAESTCRYFRDKWPEYMPVVQHGRRKLYRPEAVEVIRIIAEETQERKSAEEIAERLNALFAVNVEQSAETQKRSAAEQQKDLIEFKAGYTGLFMAMNDEIQFLRDQVKQQAAIIEQLTRRQLPAGKRRSWWPFKKGKH